MIDQECTWHVGDKMPNLPLERVLKVQADGHELEEIARLVPVLGRSDLRVRSWEEGVAKMIVSVLLAEHGIISEEWPEPDKQEGKYWVDQAPSAIHDAVELGEVTIEDRIGNDGMHVLTGLLVQLTEE